MRNEGDKNMTTNEVYNSIQERTDRLISLRKQAQDIADYANKITAICSCISCSDCPMNVGTREIVCITNIHIVR